MQKTDRFIQYEHHGKLVWTSIITKGIHRAHCLCYSCELFKPDDRYNCRIAQKVFELCVDEHLTTPVYECPHFELAK